MRTIDRATERAVARWLEAGDVCASSRQMACWLGLRTRHDVAWPYPRNPHDLNRCLKLLAEVPELREQLPRMGRFSKHWAALVARWGDIERKFLEEDSLSWDVARDAPATHALLHDVLSGVDQASASDKRRTTADGVSGATPERYVVQALVQPPASQSQTYNAEEREVMLSRMRDASTIFYGLATRTGCHPFVEFAGLINEYIGCCEQAHANGIDFASCSKHSGQPLPMPGFAVGYVNEKLECIFAGRSAIAG